MKNKEFKEWRSSVSRLLDDSWKFRKLCGKPFDRGFIGELLVLKRILDTYRSELCSSGENKIIYVGSAAKKWDIELTLNGKTIHLNAKATTVAHNNKPVWVRQSAGLFCDIKVIKVGPKRFKQYASLKTDYDRNLYYVFVDVGIWLKNRTAEFFVLSDKNAKLIFGKKYKKGRYPKIRKSPSTDFWVEYKDIKNFKDQRLRKLFKSHE